MKNLFLIALAATLSAGPVLGQRDSAASTVAKPEVHVHGKDPREFDRAELVVDTRHGINFFEGQTAVRLKGQLMVFGVDTLGFHATKLTAIRGGPGFVTKGWLVAPSFMGVYDSAEKAFRPGFGIRWEKESANKRFYTQGFIASYNDIERGWVMVLDPIEFEVRPFSGKLRQLGFGFTAEKWNGEQIMGPMVSHPIRHGLEFVFQAAPPSAPFQRFTSHPGREAPEVDRTLFRIGVIWRPHAQH